MRATINKEFRFEAAHRLPHHDGQCRNQHGHSYRFQVAVEGIVQAATGAPDEGMVVDFAVLTGIWGMIKSDFDHADLNVSLAPALAPMPTTAENIARVLLSHFIMFYPHDVPSRVVSITLWETASASVTVSSAELLVSS